MKKALLIGGGSFLSLAVAIVLLGSVVNGVSVVQQLAATLGVKAPVEEEIEGVLNLVIGDHFKNDKALFKFELKESNGKISELVFKEKDGGPEDLASASKMVEVKGTRKGKSIEVKSKKEVTDLTIAAGSKPASGSTNVGSISSFTLVNSSTNQDIMTLSSGSALDLGTLPTRNLNIRANVSGTVQFVQFDYDEIIGYSTDNAIPYALAGDTSGRYNSWTPSVGSHTVKATAAAGKGRNRTYSAPYAVSFSVVDSTPLTAPTGVTATPVSGSQINLQWNDVVNETGYVIERATVSSGFVQVTTLNQDATHYSDTGLTPSTQYTYRIKAQNALTSVYSAEVRATTISATAPLDPTNLVGTAVNSSEVSLSWTDQSLDEQGFKIERRTDTTSFAQVASIAANTVSYRDVGLSAGTQYFYRVTAFNANGNSNYTNEVSVVTPQIASAVPALNSKPGAPAKLFIDFDGAAAMTWGSYSVPVSPAYDTDGNPSLFSVTEQSQMVEIWKRVSEKFAPFNINVTTVDPGQYLDKQTTRVLVSGSGSWYGPGYGGTGYVGGFYNSSNNTVFAFEDNLGNGNPFYTAECIAHEAGHNFGLQHISQYDAAGTKISEYYRGANGVAPIMGSSYYQPRGLWWLGLNSYKATQDDLAIITGTNNGFGYRADDIANQISQASPLNVSSGAVSGGGTIEQMNDTDYYSFTTLEGMVTLNATPVLGGMADLKLQLLDSNGQVHTTRDEGLSETLQILVPAGTYYVVVSSHQGYGDLGQYTLSGTIPQ
jgi:fibronectin type 3 domain-containing protein